MTITENRDLGVAPPGNYQLQVQTEIMMLPRKKAKRRKKRFKEALEEMLDFQDSGRRAKQVIRDWRRPGMHKFKEAQDRTNLNESYQY